MIALLLQFSSSHASETITSTFGQTFVRINSGQFIMGTQNFDALTKEVEKTRIWRLKKELPAHKVSISRDFWLANTEVTQNIWYKVMGSKPGKEKRWARNDWAELPVSRITWEMAQIFINQLNDMNDGYHYRLPTEAEWEYAARAGTSGLRFFDYDEMDEYAWYRFNSGDKPMPVASQKPNAWGLYDMLGNVWEWVEDSFSAKYYHVSPLVDPAGPDLVERKVMRGGSYHCTPERIRVGIRGSQIKEKTYSVLGFRLAADRL